MSGLAAASAFGVLLAVGAVGAAFARRRWIIVRVVGDSMAPAIRDGEVLIARRVRGALRLDDVVVFVPPRRAVEADFDDGDADPVFRVKRVAALPGDPIPDWAAAARDAAHDGRIPSGRVVVKGDAVDSQDSRHYGLVALDDVVGVVVRARAARGNAEGAASRDGRLPSTTTRNSKGRP